MVRRSSCCCYSQVRYLRDHVLVFLLTKLSGTYFKGQNSNNEENAFLVMTEKRLVESDHHKTDEGLPRCLAFLPVRSIV